MNALPIKPIACPLCQRTWIKRENDGYFQSYRCYNYAECGMTYWYSTDTNYCFHRRVNDHFSVWWDVSIGCLIDVSDVGQIDYSKEFSTVLPFNITAEQIRFYLIMS